MPRHIAVIIYPDGTTKQQVFLDRKCGDSDEADRHSELIAITVPGWIRSVVGAKRRWRMDFPESDRDRQACCC